MRYDPESILQQSSLDASTITSFLSENYVSFIANDRVDDVAKVAAYLSDAGGWYVAGGRGQGGGYTPLEGIQRGQGRPGLYRREYGESTWGYTRNMGRACCSRCCGGR